MASSPDPAQKERGVRELHALSEAHDAAALSALQTLAQTADLPPSEASFVAGRLAVHPLATTADKLTAMTLHWQIDPALRAGLIGQAVTQFSTSGPEDLVALGRWLLQQGEAARVLEVIGAAQALTRQELFLVRLDALAALGRWAE